MKRIYVGVDLGGSNLRFVLASYESGKILDTDKVESPFKMKDGDGILKKILLHLDPIDRPSHFISEKMLTFIEKHNYKAKQVAGIGMSLAGKITEEDNFLGANTDPEFAKVEASGKKGIDVSSGLYKIFLHLEKKIQLENDATATAQVLSAYAKSQKGIEEKKIYYMTISTGVGGGSIHPIQNEVGHTKSYSDFSPFAPICGCNSKGCLEAYASGTGMVNRLYSLYAFFQASKEKQKQLEIFQNHESLRLGRKIFLKKWLGESALLKTWEKNKKKIDTAHLIFEKSKEDAENNISSIESYLVFDGAFRIAKACLNLAQILGVRYFYIGGGIVENHPFFIEKIASFLPKLMGKNNQILQESLSILPTPLGKNSANYGAIFLTNKNLDFSKI